MSYIRKRGAVYWFRTRLPANLAKQLVPPWWPNEAAELVGSKGRLRSELTFSLNTKDYPVAKRRGALEFARCDALFVTAAGLLKRGGKLTQTDIDAFSHHLMRERLAKDEAERAQPVGVVIIREGLPNGGFRQAIPFPLPSALPMHKEMTDADLELSTDRAKRELQDARRALATRRLADTKGPLGEIAVDREITAYLQNRGIQDTHNITSDERNAMHLAAAASHKDSAEAVLNRNNGNWIQTPSERVVTKEGIGPRLNAALKEWAKGIPSKGLRPPRPLTVKEAELAVRWFIEFHSDMFVSAIKRDHVRKYRDAVAMVPSHLTNKQRAMRLPVLLKSLPGDAVGRSLGSVTKHLNLLSAIIRSAAEEHDLADRLQGWSNPVSGQRPNKAEERPEDGGRTYSPDDLTIIFASPAVVGTNRPRAAMRDAAKFFPLIGLFTGMRLDEIGQLHVSDVRQHPVVGTWMFDVNESMPGKRLKKKRNERSGAKRFIPMHSELIACGLLAHWERRRKEIGPNATLFDGFAPNRNGTWTADWSRWFGRYLRSDEVGITDTLKVFHSFRHSFNDACRDTNMNDENRHCLLGHRRAGVNAGYGDGPFFEILNEGLQQTFKTGRYKALDLRHLYFLQV